MKGTPWLEGAIFLGLFALLLTPFFVTGSLLFPFITGKAFFFRAIVEIIFVVWLALILKNPDYRPKRSILVILFSFFVMALAVSTFLSPNPYKSFWSNYERMDGFITLLHLFMLFLVMGSVFKKPSHWRGWWKGAAFASGIMSIFAFFQLAGKLPINQGGVRVDGTLGNAAYLAVYLLFSFFITLFLFAHEKKVWLRILYAILGFSQLYVLYNTATRGAILGLLGGLVLMAIILAFKGQGKIKMAGISALLALVIAVSGFFAIRNTSFVKNSFTLSRFASLSFSEFKTQGRYFVWPMALEGIKERPVFGWGIESFNYIFNKHYDPRMYNQEPWFDRAHNMFLDWLIAGGLLGGGLFLALCLAALWKAFRDKEDNINYQGEGAAIITGLLAAYYFQGLFLFDNTVSYIYFVSFLSYLHARSATDWDKIVSLNPGNGVRRVLPAVLSVVLVFSLYYGIWKPMNAGRHIIKALTAGQNQKYDLALNELKNAVDLHTLGDGEAREQIIALSQNVFFSQNPEFQQAYLNFMTAELSKQIEAAPNDTRYRLLFGSSLNLFGLYDQALVQLEEAKKLSPRKQAIYFEIGRAYTGKKDFQKALGVLEKAYELEPKNDDAKINLGVGYIYAGNDSKAQVLFEGLPEDALLFDNRIIAALLDLGRWADIVNILRNRLVKKPNNIDDYISLASAYLRLGLRQDAISALTVVGSLRPDYKATADAYIEQIKAGKSP